MNHETAAPVEQRHGKGSSLRETNDFVSVVQPSVKSFG